MTYLVSSRRSLEIWGGGCNIYERRGGAEPSIYFTNPPYFYRPSGTDQISVLFRLGPWIVYAITKISKKKLHRLHTYTAVFCVRKYDVTACADNVIDRAVKIKDDTMLCRCKKQWKIRRYFVVKPLSSKSEVNASKTCRFLFHMHSEYIRVTRRSHSNMAFSTILDISIDFFAYWRSIREEVYSVIDCLHVTGFIQSIFGILVRDEINSSISPWQSLNGISIKENSLYSSMSS